MTLCDSETARQVQELLELFICLDDRGRCDVLNLARVEAGWAEQTARERRGSLKVMGDGTADR